MSLPLVLATLDLRTTMNYVSDPHTHDFNKVPESPYYKLLVSCYLDSSNQICSPLDNTMVTFTHISHSTGTCLMLRFKSIIISYLLTNDVFYIN